MRKTPKCLKRLEARVGIEPTHKGFADLSLTTWVPRPSLLDDQSVRLCFCREFAERSDPSRGARRRLNHRDAEELREKSPPWRLCGRKITKFLERETGFEPATSTLARSHSTTELLSLGTLLIIANLGNARQTLQFASRPANIHLIAGVAPYSDGPLPASFARRH